MAYVDRILGTWPTKTDRHGNVTETEELRISGPDYNICVELVRIGPRGGRRIIFSGPFATAAKIASRLMDGVYAARELHNPNGRG